MSTTSSTETYTYVFGGNTVVGANLNLQFSLSTGSTLPSTFNDTVAITMAANLQNDLRTAGFTDATVTVAKSGQSTTYYTLSGGQFT